MDPVLVIASAIITMLLAVLVNREIAQWTGNILESLIVSLALANMVSFAVSAVAFVSHLFAFTPGASGLVSIMQHVAETLESFLINLVVSSIVDTLVSLICCLVVHAMNSLGEMVIPNF